MYIRNKLPTRRSTLKLPIKQASIGIVALISCILVGIIYMNECAYRSVTVYYICMNWSWSIDPYISHMFSRLLAVIYLHDFHKFEDSLMAARFSTWPFHFYFFSLRERGGLCAYCKKKERKISAHIVSMWDRDETIKIKTYTRLLKETYLNSTTIYNSYQFLMCTYVSTRYTYILSYCVTVRPYCLYTNGSWAS